MKQSTLFRLLLLGLPIGSVVLGAISLIHHFSKKADAPTAFGQAREVTEKDLEFYVRRFASDIGPRHLGDEASLRKAASFIEGTLGPNNIGFAGVERQTFTVNAQECVNLIAEAAGDARKAEIIVIGAHYDTVIGSPGANDNASGLSVLLGLAQSFVGTTQARTLRFAAFANEEKPYALTENMGSHAYARRCQARGDRIVAMLSLETLGYYTDAPGSQHFPPPWQEQFPKTGNFLAFVGPRESQSIIDLCRDAFKAVSSFPLEAAALPAEVPDALRSDHWAFLQFGFPAFMITDTANFRYPHYHLPADTADQLNYPALTTVAQSLAKMVQRLANP